MTRIIKLLLLCLVGLLPSVLALYFYSQLRTQRIGSGSGSGSGNGSGNVTQPAHKGEL